LFTDGCYPYIVRPITLILYIALDQETGMHDALIDPLTEQQRFFGHYESLWRVGVQSYLAEAEGRRQSTGRQQ
jgi:hypothetical protein